MKDITVVMPCWLINQELIELTQNAIDSLGDVNLILIDNASTMGGGMLRDKANVYVRNKENLGYAKAVNQGIKLANTDMVAIANDDIRVSSNWQEVAKEVFAQDSKIYSCHFKMIEYDQQFEAGTLIAKQGYEKWCSSSFFVVNFPFPYLYDENFLNSYDDYDYWYRVRDNNLYTAYTNKASYQHKHSTSQKLVPERTERDKKNYEYYKQIHGEYPDIQFNKMYPEQKDKTWMPMP